MNEELGVRHVESPIMLSKEPTTNSSLPSLRQIEKKKKKEKDVVPAFYTGLLTILLIITYLFTLKLYEPVNNLVLTGGIVSYPFTFLVIALISKKYGFKSARKSIYISSLLYLIFAVFSIIGILPKANEASNQYNIIVQYLLANNFVDVLGFRLFYPTLGQFFGVLIAYIVSHLLYSTVYNAIHSFTVEYLATGLGIFIAYIIDRLLFVFILFAQGLINGDNTFAYVIQVLTSEFMFATLAAVLVIIIYSIICSIEKKKESKIK